MNLNLSKILLQKMSGRTFIKNDTANSRFNLSRFFLPVVMSFGFFVSGNAQAQTTNVFWDGATNGTYGGTGSLNTGTARFSTNGPGGAGPYVPPNNALYILNFGGATGTVTQSSGTVTNSGMNWLSSGYTFSTGVTNARTWLGSNAAIAYITNNANLNIIGTGVGNPSSLTISSMNLNGGAGSTVTLSNNTGETFSLIFGTSSATAGRTNSVNTIVNGAGRITLGTSGSSGFIQSGNITNNSTGGLVLSNGASGDITFSGSISGSGAVVLTNASSGIFWLTASNSFAGGTTIFATNASSILAISNSAAFGSGPVTIAGVGTNYIRNYSNNIIITNAIAITNGGVLRIATTNTGWKGTYSGVISGGGGIVTRFTDTQILPGTNNSFGGGINIASATKVQVVNIGMAGSNSSLGTNGVVTFSSDTGTGAAGELYWLGTNSEISDKIFALTTVSTSGSAGMKLFAGENNSGGTNQTLTLKGDISSSGAANLTVTLGTFNGNTLAVNGAINQTLGYTNSLVVTNNDTNGTVILSGNNSYGGNTTINGGTLALNGANTGAGTVLMKAICFLRLGHTNALVNGALAGASSITNMPTVNLTVGGAHTVGAYGNAGNEGWNMNFTNSSGIAATLTFSAPTNIITSSALTGGGRTLTNQSADLTLIFNGAVDIGSSTSADTTFSGPGHFTILGSLFNTNTNGIRALSKSGAGTLTLSASNNYNGITTISAGTLSLTAAGALGTNAVTLSGTLRVNNSGTNESKGNLTVTGNSTIDLGTDSTGVLRFATATGWTTGRILTVANSAIGAKLYITDTNNVPLAQIASAESPTATPSLAADGLLTFSAAKSNPVITVTPGVYTYNGASQGPGAGQVNTGGSTGTLTLSYSGTGYGPTAVAPTAAGTYTVTASVGADSNYNAGSSAATSFTIQPLVLAGGAITITPPVSLVYDRSAKSHTASAPGVSGFSLSYEGRAGTTYGPSTTAPSVVGNYTVTATDTDPNYTGSSSVNFSITAKGLTITGASATSRAFDGTTTVAISGGTLQGVEGGDTVTLGGSPSGSITSAEVGTGKAVTVTGFALGGADAGNYSLTQPTGLTVDITSAGPTFDDAYPGKSLSEMAPNGLTYLMNYAFGGDASNAPTLPTQVTSDASKLTLEAIVRTNDSNVSVIGEAVGGLADYATPSAITSVSGSTSNVSQSGVPTGCQRQQFSVNQGSDDKKFLRLKAIKQ